MISIIMPLYNAQKFLEEAIESVLQQTYSRFELICVDDGSTDNTVSIVKKYMTRDKRVKLIKNGKKIGAAIARNNGIKKAQGDYISFLDGDDIFEPDMYQKAHDCIEANKLDLVCFEYIHVPTEKINEKQFVFHSNTYLEKYCKAPFRLSDINYIDFISWAEGPWNKLIRKDFIKSNKLEFQNLQCSNDIYFSLMTYILSDRIMFLKDNKPMIYARDHFTPTRISYARDPMCAYLALKKVIDELQDRDLLQENAKYILAKAFVILISALDKSKDEAIRVQFYNFLQEEGIDGLLEPFLEMEGCTDLKNKLLKFKGMKYDSRWYLNEGRVEWLLQHMGDRILDEIKDNDRIIVWGAGRFGRAIINYLNQHNIHITTVIDTNVNKAGTQICGHVISYNKDYVFQNNDAVIVSPRGVYYQVDKAIDNKEVKIIDMCRILDM